MPITRTCRISGKEFTITDQEVALLEKLAPVIGGEKFVLPFPTISPEERRRRKLPYKNYFSLFKTTDMATGETRISSFPSDTPYTVYSQERWWSDGWNPHDYALEYDQKKTVFDHIAFVQKSTPFPALDNQYKELVNSEYINGNGPSKDCYLTSSSAYNERCLYGWFIFHSFDILDANYVIESENCSHSQHVWKCYSVHFGWDISECRDSRYIFSCQGCQYILGGVGLHNQKYQILNAPCTKEEYEGTLQKIQSDPVFRKDFEQRVVRLIQKVGLEENILTGSFDSTGDFCYDSKNAYECYNIGDCEDVLYIRDATHVKDSAHISMWGDHLSHSYDCIDIGLNSNSIYFSAACWEGASYNFYSTRCQGCSFIFGCSSIRHKSYCIFNKQYSKEAWEKTVKKIIKQMISEGTWGEFLDPKYSLYNYNESFAMDIMPLSREEGLRLGFRWSDREEIAPEGIKKIIPGERLPENIREIPDDILHWAIKCKKTGKLFQIQPLELELHRKFSTPIPRIHPIERIKIRLAWDKREFSFDF